MYRLDEQGGIHVLGWLVPLLGGEFWCEFADHHDVLHEGLPHFLADMRPQGFMGRDFVQRFARELGLPLRLNDWNDDAHLLAMALFGPDLPGNLIMGDESLRHHYVMREHELRSRDECGHRTIGSGDKQPGDGPGLQCGWRTTEVHIGLAG